MATWTTDILGTGLAHHMPTKQERTLARRIARRWQAWHPLLLHELRQRPHPPGFVAREMLRFEHLHAKALTRMLSDGIRWTRICHARLDDPRYSDDDRAYRIAHPYYSLRQPKVKVKLTLEEKRARRAERFRLREAAREADATRSRLARGLTPDKSVARFVDEYFVEEPDASSA